MADFSSIFPVENADDFFSQFNKNGSDSLSVLTQWCDGIGVADDTMRSYLVNCMQKQVPASFEGYNNYVKAAIGNTSKLSFGMKALGTVGNIAFSMLASFAVQAIIDLGNAEEKAIQQAEELAQKTSETFEETKSELKELDSLIKEYNDLQVSGKWYNTPIETKKQIQEDINKLLEDEAEYVDLINGKYSESTQELYKKKQLKREELEQDAYDAKEAAKGSLEWKGTNDQQRNLGRIDMFIPIEMTDEEAAVLEEYKHLFDINPAQNVDGVDIAKQFNITWGGEWKTPDTPHFEISESWVYPSENKETDMEELNKLKDKVAFLSQALDRLGDRITTLENPMIYNHIDKNMPDWARPTIEKLVNEGKIKGNEKGELNLTDDMLKLLVIINR